MTAGSPGRAVRRRPGGARPPRVRDQRGSVTAETALVLPSLVLVLALCASALGAGAAKIRCLDAARAAARELARGEDAAAAHRVVRRLAPGTRVRFVQEGELIRVVVSDDVRAQLPGVDRFLGIAVHGEAVALPEAR